MILRCNDLLSSIIHILKFYAKHEITRGVFFFHVSLKLTFNDLNNRIIHIEKCLIFKTEFPFHSRFVLRTWECNTG